MTTFFLVRHAAHDNVGGFLAGRAAGVRLGEAGRRQADVLAQRMRRETFSTIHVSPRERTQETAAAIARQSAAVVQLAPELDEIDFGAWSGQSFEHLNEDPLWRRWNEARTVARTPGGESILDVQGRVIAYMQRVRERAPHGSLVLVSHADPIRCAVAWCLGLSLASMQSFDIAPASISIVTMADWGAKVLQINEVPHE